MARNSFQPQERNAYAQSAFNVLPSHDLPEQAGTGTGTNEVAAKSESG